MWSIVAKRKNKKKKKQNNTQDISLILVIIFSILLTVLIYTQSGTVGIALSDFFWWNVRISKIHITNWSIYSSN